ncbi:hypothetical protein SAMN02910265_00311 [Ruminococcus flavefaciens]|uniref:DUF4190 domain-containing protein n=1 Tax=Ruminococcus flavefaciens TaxID=1265 RepID=A0A1H6HTB1_RUMFL|nr:DUF4190 domain-containing protein [Ruminococcus flavefaciens]SEH39268.1 hypothetical protein SAMN02910265_00311 [Ruminococcus flavefaciens]
MDDFNNMNNNDQNNNTNNLNNGYGNGEQYNAQNNGNQYNGYGNGGQYSNQNGGYPYNNGYNGNNPFTGNYNGYPQYNMYNNEGIAERKGAGFAIASFVISLVNLMFCATMLSIVTVPLCLIFSLISLVGKRKGTAFAVIGVIVSVISLIFFVYIGFLVYKIGPDLVYFSEHSTQIIEEYDRDGTIPEQYEKYRDPKYDKYWNRMGYDSFDELFAEFIKNQKKNQNSGRSYYYENDTKKDRNSARYSGNDLVAVV